MEESPVLLTSRAQNLRFPEKTASDADGMAAGMEKGMEKGVDKDIEIAVKKMADSGLDAGRIAEIMQISIEKVDQMLSAAED